jgi:hypothetical protein
MGAKGQSQSLLRGRASGIEPRVIGAVQIILTGFFMAFDEPKKTDRPASGKNHTFGSGPARQKWRKPAKLARLFA